MDARTYDDGTLPAGHVVSRDCLDWVAWMLEVTAEAMRVTDGPVIWVAAGVTRDRCYWPGCEGLMWEWWKRGGECQLYRPVAWNKVDPRTDFGCGVPGSGQDDWFRSDWEFCMCFKRPGALPWSDNTACGHEPRELRPGGPFSNRSTNGVRTSVAHTKRKPDGSMERQVYDIPERSNPGNILRVPVGGGRLGHDAAHSGEAPYPPAVPERFILSCCPPGGIVLDCFGGTGTTAEVAIRHGRRAIGLDLRMSQCELATRRLTRPHAPVRRSSRPADPLPLFDEVPA